VLVSDLTGSGNFEPAGVAAAFGLVALAVEAIDPVGADGKILLLDRNGKLLRTFSGVGSGPERSPSARTAGSSSRPCKVRRTPPSGSNPKAASPSSTWRTVSGGRRPGLPVFRTSAPRSWSRVASGSDRTRATRTSSSRRCWTSSRIPSPSRPTRVPHSPRCSRTTRWQSWISRQGHGTYIPDGIGAFRAHGRTYLFTANEGDTRDDAIEVGDAAVTLDPAVFANSSTLKNDAALGGLEVSTLRQDARPNARGEYRRVVSFGARSIAVWNTSAQRVYESGARLERITATRVCRWAISAPATSPKTRAMEAPWTPIPQ
jgi:hypothetical protein